VLPENLTSAKHVESVFWLCLDEGSIPSSSTFRKQIKLNIPASKNYSFWLFQVTKIASNTFNKIKNINFTLIMGKNKDDVLLSFLVGFLFGITFFSFLERRKKRTINLKKVKNNLDKGFQKVKNNLDKGFQTDTENLRSDWQHIYYDLDKSYKKLRRNYEAV